VDLRIQLRAAQRGVAPRRHLEARIATMSAVEMRSDGPIFGQSVRSW